MVHVGAEQFVHTYRWNWIELNGIWVQALPGPMRLGLIKTGPLCPMFYAKLEEPCKTCTAQTEHTVCTTDKLQNISCNQFE